MHKRIFSSFFRLAAWIGPTILALAITVMLTMTPEEVKLNFCQWITGRGQDCLSDLNPILPWLGVAVVLIFTLLVALFRREEVHQMVTSGKPVLNNDGIITVGQSGGNNTINREPSAPPQRTLTDTQQSIILMNLSRTPPSTVTVVRSRSREAQGFSEKIENLLERAGWKVLHLLPFTDDRGQVYDGIMIGHIGEKTPQFICLADSLRAAGIPVSESEINGNIDTPILIEVGSVPMPRFQEVIDKL
ncbi:hypothetical protein [Tropicimonas sediminicola]|uniref:Uncharacterized protein n=1 Tax=Tropicimonas sediminicola TaxID=1031541 RepID=A0A239GKR8_9RHOB|nr:hypothetical protein [Tropicimonas sediminicola]SNS69886.1 hypothetical protein SAMN05421757_1031 [Tropicimonas sediminicola]